MSKEIWKTVVQASAFEVSSQGRFRRKEPMIRIDHGYPFVSLGGQSYGIHTLVLTAFLGPRPKDYCCHHKNGDKTDNRPENLEWLPRWKHFIKHRGEDSPVAVLTETKVQRIRDLHKRFGWGYRRIGVFLKLNLYTVRSVLRKESWSWLDENPIFNRSVEEND